MIHAAITAIFCIAVFFLKFPDLLYFLPAAFYLGREITQAEYRYIEEFCDRKRSRMPWYAVIVPEAWTVKGIFDWVLPLAVSLIFYFASNLIFL